MSRPRILFVGAFPPPGSGIVGGMVTSCRALMQSSLPDRAQLVLLDTTQISNPPPGLFMRGVLALRRIKKYRLMFGEQKPDVVLLFAAVGASLVEKGYMAWYARKRGVPALMFPRGGGVFDACRDSAFARWWVRLAFASSRMVLCQGPRWREFARQTLGFAERDLPIIANWTATPALLRIGAQRQSRLEEPLRLLFVGWLDREKGVAELLQSLGEVPNVELALAGEGNHSSPAREFAAARGLQSRLHFLGWLDQAGLEREYARADIFVLPSWAEGLPNAMIEAMAAGLPCVVSAVGNIPDVITDGEQALLVQPRDVGALTAALRRLANDAGLRALLGRRAHEFATKEFGVERAIDQLVSAVDTAIAHPRRT